MATNAGRIADRARVMAAMTIAVAGRDRTPLAEALRAADVPAGEVNSVSDILSDPHIKARGMVGQFDHPTAGPFPALRLPLREAGGPAPALGTPPLLGSGYRGRARCARLGLDGAAITALRAERVI